MQPIASQSRDWTVGEALRDGFALLAASREQALVYLLLGLAAHATDAGIGADASFEAMARGAAEDLLFGAVLAALQFWVVCGIARVAVDAARGRAVRWERFRVGMADYTEASIVAGAAATGITFGLVAFALPGLFLSLAWSMSLFAALEHRARWTKALGYSRRLTTGCRGRLAMLALAVTAIGAPAAWISGEDTLRTLQDLEERGVEVRLAPTPPCPELVLAAAAPVPDDSRELRALIAEVWEDLALLLLIYAGAAVYVRLEREERPAAAPSAAFSTVPASFPLPGARPSR